MAKNTDHGYRIGSVRDRGQTFNPQTDQYVKRDDNSGRFMGAKATPYKGVAQEPDGRKNKIIAIADQRLNRTIPTSADGKKRPSESGPSRFRLKVRYGRGGPALIGALSQQSTIKVQA